MHARSFALHHKVPKLISERPQLSRLRTICPKCTRNSEKQTERQARASVFASNSCVLPQLTAEMLLQASQADCNMQTSLLWFAQGIGPGQSSRSCLFLSPSLLPSFGSAQNGPAPGRPLPLRRRSFQLQSAGTTSRSVRLLRTQTNPE